MNEIFPKIKIVFYLMLMGCGALILSGNVFDENEAPIGIVALSLGFLLTVWEIFNTKSFLKRIFKKVYTENFRIRLAKDYIMFWQLIWISFVFAGILAFIFVEYNNNAERDRYKVALKDYEENPIATYEISSSDTFSYFSEQRHKEILSLTLEQRKKYLKGETVQCTFEKQKPELTGIMRYEDWFKTERLYLLWLFTFLSIWVLIFAWRLIPKFFKLVVRTHKKILVTSQAKI